LRVKDLCESNNIVRSEDVCVSSESYKPDRVYAIKYLLLLDKEAETEIGPFGIGITWGGYSSYRQFSATNYVWVNSLADFAPLGDDKTIFYASEHRGCSSDIPKCQFKFRSPQSYTQYIGVSRFGNYSINERPLQFLQCASSDSNTEPRGYRQPNSGGRQYCSDANEAKSNKSNRISRYPLPEGFGIIALIVFCVSFCLSGLVGIGIVWIYGRCRS
jgi:hypothetical protein